MAPNSAVVTGVWYRGGLARLTNRRGHMSNPGNVNRVLGSLPTQPYCPPLDPNVCSCFTLQVTLLPLFGLELPLDLFLSLSPLELLLELSAPPSVPPRRLLTSGLAGLTSRGLFVPYGGTALVLDLGNM